MEDIKEMRYSPLHQNEIDDEYDVLHYDCVKDLCALGLIQKTDDGINSLYLGEGVPDEMLLFLPNLEKTMVRINTNVKEDGMYPNQLILIDAQAMKLIHPQHYPEFFETMLILSYKRIDANTIQIVTADVEEHSSEGFEAWRKLGHERKATVKDLMIIVD